MMNFLPKVVFLVSVIFSALALAADPIDIPKKIHIKVPLQAGVTLGDVVLEAYREIFANIGVDVEFSNCVPSTCAYSVLSGDADGEGGRVAAYKSLHPTLIRVEEPIFNLVVEAFAVGDKIQMDEWADLKESNYKVGYQKGYYYAIEKLTPLIPAKNMIETNSTEIAFSQLLKKNIDIYIGSEETMLSFSKKENSAIKRLCVLDSVKIYPYLHPKHKSLADILALEIKRYKASGKLDRIFKDHQLFVGEQPTLGE